LTKKKKEYLDEDKRQENKTLLNACFLIILPTLVTLKNVRNKGTDGFEKVNNPLSHAR
jgi:hypothetical protein